MQSKMIFTIGEGILCSSFYVKEFDVIVYEKYFPCINLLGSLHLRQWSVTHLMTLSDFFWAMIFSNAFSYMQYTFNFSKICYLRLNWCEQWAVSLGRHVLITVSDRGDNKGQWATHSFIKWLTSTASVLSLVVLIPLNFLYGIVKSIFLIVRKSRNDATNQCSVTAELKYAILQWANRDPATIFTSMCECQLRQSPDV